MGSDQQQGSARRSLMRMGLPMEKGLFNIPGSPPPMPLVEDLSKSKTADGEDGTSNRNRKQSSSGLDNSILNMSHFQTYQCKVL